MRRQPFALSSSGALRMLSRLAGVVALERSALRAIAGYLERAFGLSLMLPTMNRMCMAIDIERSATSMLASRPARA